MHEAISPVVQVVTGGTDWPAIVAAISTGVVGLAGIGGTFWQGKRARETASSDLKVSLDATTTNLDRSIDAENRPAWLTEKRRIYAAYQAALSTLVVAIAADEAVHVNTDASQEERTEARTRAYEARHEAFATMTEVRMVAPEDVIELAAKVGLFLAGDAESGLDEETALRIRESLYLAMRADLDVAE